MSNADDICKAITEQRLAELKEQNEQLKEQMSEMYKAFYNAKLPDCLRPKSMPAYIIPNGCSISKPKIYNPCENCIYADSYPDMGATIPICKKFGDLERSVMAREGRIPCDGSVTYEDVDRMLCDGGSK